MVVGGRGGSIDGVGGSLQPGWKEAELSGSLEEGPSAQALVTFLALQVVAVMVITCCLRPGNVQSRRSLGHLCGEG